MPDSDIVERRVPVPMFLFKASDHSPLDSEGLQWLADQLCSAERVHPDRTMSTGWIPYQAAYEYPHLIDEITRLRAEDKALRERVAMAAKHLENAGLHEEGTAVRQALQEKPDDK